MAGMYEQVQNHNVTDFVFLKNSHMVTTVTHYHQEKFSSCKIDHHQRVLFLFSSHGSKAHAVEYYNSGHKAHNYARVCIISH